MTVAVGSRTPVGSCVFSDVMFMQTLMTAATSREKIPCVFLRGAKYKICHVVNTKQLVML